MHHWKFVQKGGFDQVIIETGEDIKHLGDLNRKLWATLSCPISGVHFDPTTLQLIDDDCDGKIRISEILSAVEYLKEILKSLEIVVKSSNSVELHEIRNDTCRGADVLEAAKQILLALDKPDKSEISLNDVLLAKDLFSKTSFNGDGVISLSSIGDNFLVVDLFNEIIKNIGSVYDSNKEVGINLALIEEFESRLLKLQSWFDKFNILNKNMFLSYNEAKEAVALSLELNNKIENYFIREMLISYDENTKTALVPEVDFYRQFINSDISSLADKISDMPISIANGQNCLNLTERVNPIFENKLHDFKRLWVDKLFKTKNSISKEDFETIRVTSLQFKQLFDDLNSLGLENIDEGRIKFLLNSNAFAILKELIAEDNKFCKVSSSMNDVEKLLRLCENFYTLLNNFVVFRDFYTSSQKAIFQAGTLFIDGRSCDLCVKVEDMSKHAELAGLSKTYLLYCECSRAAGNYRMTIAAAVTNGDSNNLMIGRNGVFYDRDGLDWDATIVKIIDFPISVRQAFWLPYKKTASFIKTQVEKLAKAKEEAGVTITQPNIKPSLLGQAEQKKDAQPTQVTSAPPAQPVDVGKFAGIFAAIGLALGAMGTAIASIMSGFLALKFWQMPLVILGLMLTISGPSMLIAWIKLAQRNLGPLLDASGWAINTRAKINVPFGATLTQMAELPKGSSRTLNDPYDDKSSKKSVATIAGVSLLIFFITMLIIVFIA